MNNLISNKDKHIYEKTFVFPVDIKGIIQN